MHHSTPLKVLFSSYALNPSLYVLQQKLKDFFHHQFPGEVAVFPNSGCDPLWIRKDIVNVVFFGDSFSRLLRINFWPRDCRFRFHFLCRGMRNAFAELTDTDPESFGVIPRYELFPVSPSVVSKLEPKSFILSSRFVKDKNVLPALDFMRAMQMEDPRHKFFFCGPRLTEDQTRTLESYCPELGLNLLGDLGLDWAESDFGMNPVVVNFSTSLTEDFGVSVAQAQEKGMGLFLSRWGAHLDVTGENVQLIAPENIHARNWVFDSPEKSVANKLSLEALTVFSWDELFRAKTKLLQKHSELHLDHANSQKISPALEDLIRRNFSN